LSKIALQLSLHLYMLSYGSAHRSTLCSSPLFWGRSSEMPLDHRTETPFLHNSPFHSCRFRFK